MTLKTHISDHDHINLEAAISSSTAHQFFLRATGCNALLKEALPGAFLFYVEGSEGEVAMAVLTLGVLNCQHEF